MTALNDLRFPSKNGFCIVLIRGLTKLLQRDDPTLPPKLKRIPQVRVHRREYSKDDTAPERSADLPQGIWRLDQANHVAESNDDDRHKRRRHHETRTARIVAPRCAERAIPDH
jgi:hypothetical protein